MKIEELHPGMLVECVSAKYGKYLPEMTKLIGTVVTIDKVLRDCVEVKECPGLVWHSEDFIPIETVDLTPVSSDEFLSLIGAV